MSDARGKIILLNGASSSGKSTLAKALQQTLEEPFWHYSIDHLISAECPPMARVRAGDFDWKSLRPGFFEGFHRSLPAIALAGNNLIVEHIIETEEWRSLLLHLLEGFDVFAVGIHCSLTELERRERERGDRPIGDARRDFESIHSLCQYDLEVNSEVAIGEIADHVINAWRERTRPAAFDRMRTG